MFVPVNCTNCGKPFQVPETALGKLAPCPWCETVVTALPVSASPAQTEPPPASQQQSVQPNAVPLTLDDEPEAQPVAKQPAETLPAPSATIPVAPPAKRSRFNLATILIGAVLVVVVMVATMTVRGYGTGHLSAAGWTDFTASDGSFTVALPGTPKEEDIEANPDGSVTGGKRYAVRGWYSKTNAWVSYTDLAPALVQKLPADKDRVVAAGVLRVERDREVSRLKGTVTKEVERRLKTGGGTDGWGVEVHGYTNERSSWR